MLANMSNEGAAPLVGLIGPAGAGKDTVAHYLVEQHGFHRTAFADKLREFVTRIDPTYAALVASFGGYEAAHHAHPSIRQRLGEVGNAARELISSEVWVDAVDTEIADVDGPIVVSDVRQRNEAEWLEEMGGVLVAVSRPGHDLWFGEAPSLAASAPLTIDNDGDVHMLRERVDMIVEDFLL